MNLFKGIFILRRGFLWRSNQKNGLGLQLASRHCVLHWQSLWESTCTQPVNLPSHSAKLIHPKSRLINSSKRLRQLPNQKEQKKYHIPASIIIAQAGTESNWGRSKLAYKYNNLFGIKATSKKNRVRMYTKENINGKTVKVKQYFAVYNSWEASLKAPCPWYRSQAKRI